MRGVLMLSSIGLALLAATPAFAADPILYGTSSDATLPVYDSPAYDWSGFYAGVFGAARIEDDATDFGLGLALGANAEVGFGLVGAEVAVIGLADEAAANGVAGYAQVLGRGGILVTDELLAYGAVGLGTELDAADEGEVLVGGGLEYSVTDGVSLRGQYLYGVPLDGGDASQQLSLGANFHF